MKILPALSLALTLFLTACSHTVSPKPAIATPTPTPLALAPSYSSDKIDVFLVPLQDFDFDLTASIAQSLSQELGIHVKPTVAMGDAGLVPFPDTKQYAGEDILDLAQRAVTNFPGVTPETAFIILTSRDINQKNRALRFNFAIHSTTNNIAVISSARLALSASGIGWTDRATFNARVKKMVKRSIGDIYYHYPRSTDIHDLMYAPIMSLADVDRMGDDYLAAKK